jgi:hypothetical protein
MKFTVEENREAIKRYRHIKPAKGRRSRPCSATCPGTVRTCAREKGHRGPHVAHGWRRNVVAVWDSGTGAQASAEAVSRASKPRKGSAVGTRRPVGLRTRAPGGALQAIKDLVVGAFSSAEEIAFIILFIVFVKFGFDWLMLILGG